MMNSGEMNSARRSAFTFALSLVLLVAASGKTAADSDQTSAERGSFFKRYDVRVPHNAASCSECHAIPGPGGSSHVIVFRAGSGFRKASDESPDGASGSLRSRNDIGGARIPLSAFGDAYIEAIPDKELLELAEREAMETRGQIQGQATIVSVLEAGPGTKAIGRFGWKAQHATLLSASADALRHELGVPNEFFPLSEGLANGKNREKRINQTTDADLVSMIRFLRSLQPIPRDPVQSATEASREGLAIFDKIGCSVCHVRTLTTAAAGTRMYGGTLVVSRQIGDKEIHPYSDFLLHNVGTGDGIAENIRPQDYDPRTLNKFRTPPLWGLRYRVWMMHDGKAVTYHQAIMRHGGEAAEVVRRYLRLTPVEREDLMEFLNSL